MKILLLVAILVSLLSSYSLPTLAGQTTNCTKEVPQEGRNEPRYTGMFGYTSVGGTYEFSDYDKKLPRYPFQIPILTQTGPNLWEESSEKIPAKLAIEVIGQVLEHVGYGRYTGYLLVQVVGTKKIFKIDPSHFSPVAYWKCNPFSAVKYSPFIGKVKKNAKPVDRDGKWETMGQESKVFCAETKSYSKDQILCYVYKEWKYGYGGVGLFFSSSDIEIIY
jgi:hypothetical protein